ncbi:hypothetical protein Tco_0078596 [Tanacetum coccineum]
MSTQQDIYAVGSENRPPMLNKENYIPLSSRLLHYAKSRPNGKLIYNSIMNGPNSRRVFLNQVDCSAMYEFGSRQSNADGQRKWGESVYTVCWAECRELGCSESSAESGGLGHLARNYTTTKEKGCILSSDLVADCSKERSRNPITTEEQASTLRELRLTRPPS